MTVGWNSRYLIDYILVSCVRIQNGWHQYSRSRPCAGIAGGRGYLWTGRRWFNCQCHYNYVISYFWSSIRCGVYQWPRFWSDVVRTLSKAGITPGISEEPAWACARIVLSNVCVPREAALLCVRRADHWTADSISSSIQWLLGFSSEELDAPSQIPLR